MADAAQNGDAVQHGGMASAGEASQPDKNRPGAEHQEILVRGFGLRLHLSFMGKSTHNEPIGYFVTLNFYGHWLPGRAEGWMGEARGCGEPKEFGQPNLEKWVKQQMAQPAVVLKTQEERAMVLHESIKTVNILEGKLGAVHVRTNHVHLVCGLEIGARHLLQSLKRGAGMRLRQHWNRPGAKVWSSGGSCRVIYGEGGWNAAVEYVVERQGEPMAVWAGGEICV